MRRHAGRYHEEVWNDLHQGMDMTPVALKKTSIKKIVLKSKAKNYNISPKIKKRPGSNVEVYTTDSALGTYEATYKGLILLNTVNFLDLLLGTFKIRCL